MCIRDRYNILVITPCFSWLWKLVYRDLYQACGLLWSEVKLLLWRCADPSQLGSLDCRLRERYTGSTADPNVTWVLGAAVAAYYSDMFYRAKIVGFDDTGIEVLLLSHGICKVS